MSLKVEIETWASALHAYDHHEMDNALMQFEKIADTARILFNIGLIHATLGEHEIAVAKFRAAVEHDSFLAIAYFQMGVSNFLMGEFEDALKDFDDALLYLRGHQTIDYEQLGLKFKLYSAEALFNKGLALICMGAVDQGLVELSAASLEKVTTEHSVIDEAIADRGDGYTVFSIPVGVLFRPSEVKMKNAKTKDYLGKAVLVSAADSSDAFTTFTGSTRLHAGMNPSGTAFVDKPRPIQPAGSAAAAAPVAVLVGAPNNVDPITGKRIPQVSKGLLTPASTPPQSVLGGRPVPSRTGTLPSLTGIPTRGLSVRSKPAYTEEPQPMRPGPGAAALEGIYEEYAAAPVPLAGNDKIAAWANNNAISGSVGLNARRPSAASTIRTMSRRGTRRRGGAASRDGEDGIMEEDEEEDYVRVRVKLHLVDEIRGMVVHPEATFEEFVSLVHAKFDCEKMDMKFRDHDDDHKVSLRDESDWEMALENAREHAQGKHEGKLEIWCTDLSKPATKAAAADEVVVVSKKAESIVSEVSRPVSPVKPATPKSATAPTIPTDVVVVGA